MKVSDFARSWHGIDFTTLPIRLEPRSFPNSEFYSALYGTLGRQALDARWLARKQLTGSWIMRNVLSKFGNPAILSIGSGFAIAEQMWLAHSYDVTLHEIQAESLIQARIRYPHASVLIGDILAIDVPKKFDVITLLAIDYAMSDSAMSAVFRKLRQILKPGGVILVETVNALTVRRMVLEPIKRWILRRYEKPGWIFWGWSRTPNAIAGAARRAGLFLRHEAVGLQADYIVRSRFLLRLPTLNKPELILIFERPSDL